MGALATVPLLGTTAVAAHGKQYPLAWVCGNGTRSMTANAMLQVVPA